MTPQKCCHTCKHFEEITRNIPQLGYSITTYKCAHDNQTVIDIFNLIEGCTYWEVKE